MDYSCDGAAPTGTAPSAPAAASHTPCPLIGPWVLCTPCPTHRATRRRCKLRSYRLVYSAGPPGAHSWRRERPYAFIAPPARESARRAVLFCSAAVVGPMGSSARALTRMSSKVRPLHRAALPCRCEACGDREGAGGRARVSTGPASARSAYDAAGLPKAEHAARAAWPHFALESTHAARHGGSLLPSAAARYLRCHACPARGPPPPCRVVPPWAGAAVADVGAAAAVIGVPIR